MCIGQCVSCEHTELRFTKASFFTRRMFSVQTIYLWSNEKVSGKTKCCWLSKKANLHNIMSAYIIYLPASYVPLIFQPKKTQMEQQMISSHVADQSRSCETFQIYNQILYSSSVFWTLHYHAQHVCLPVKSRHHLFIHKTNLQPALVLTSSMQIKLKSG